MNKFKIAGWLIAAIACLGALAVFLKKRADRLEARRAAWDAYLSSDVDDPQAVAAVSPADILGKDLDSIEGLKADEKLTLMLGMNKPAAKKLAEKLAKAGCSSNYDSSLQALEVMLCGPMDKDSLKEISKTVQTALKKSDGRYEGYIFE